MIDKISTSMHIDSTSRLKKKKVDKKQKVDNQVQHVSLQEKVIHAISKEEITEKDELRKKLIVETLTQALGEKASNEIVFKQLTDKIDKALENSPVTQEQLESILKNLHAKDKT